MKKESIKESIISGLLWKFAERIGAQGVAFIVNIILARLLCPEDYGLISLITIFLAVSSVFIQSGFGTSLIQKKDADNIDFSTVFYFNILMSLIFYFLLYIIAPYISKFYNEPTLTPIVRVMSISLIISAVNNIQHAYVSKTMQFKRFFYSTLIGTILSGFVGVGMAYMGFGVWAIVAQQLFNSLVDTIILWFTVKWRPQLVFSIERLKGLFSFGWKLLISGLIDTLYTNIYGLLIGKIYNPSLLGLYNRGEQFPSLIVTNINGPIQSVLLPALSEEQDNKERLKAMVRRAIVTSSFIIYPMMIGMAAVAKPMIMILLGERWLGCVFILQISCITLAFWPIHTANLQAINAVGRSDIFLKLEIIKKVLGISVLVISIPFGINVMVIGRACLGFVGTIINAFPNKKLLEYSFVEQWKDLIPSLVLSLFMGVVVMSVELLGFSSYITLLIQIPVGAITYFGLAYLFKFECFNYILNMLKQKGIIKSKRYDEAFVN